ncbi:Metallo-dependent phosphatase-like protein [Suillus plorans]|uniref:Metallo-dependent phosphatase-like protein n=1 Tax=Suillus plorans TaxID=116603 RepID=A0A9P7DGD5_9AGAM|nr:Metallo-dependent phosphatase-like protein [Suillus plorans]KAG1791733.1 Metallo-dependent phosphatase-like protein [Suillus plorans]
MSESLNQASHLQGSEGFHTPSAHVYISYDPANPPSHPGLNWTRFVCISDTHSHTFSVPSGDVLLHSGDLSRLGREDEIRVTIEWLRSLDHGVKIIIAGNHDLPLHEEWYEDSYYAFHDKKESSTAIKNLVDSDANRDRGLIYLQDEQYTFSTKEGGREWSVYGSPWQPYFGGWAFNYLPEEAYDRVSAIPEVDILLTHGPPHNILDKTFTNVNAGCPALLAHLSKMRGPPLLHVFGHIHEARGAVRHSWLQAEEDQCFSDSECSPALGTRETIMVNAANLPLGRQAIRPGPGGQRIPCGGLGFQPVIVDLLDSATRLEM